MPTLFADKVRIKAGYTLLTVNAPASFKKELTGLPPGVKISDSSKTYDQIHWFVLNKSQLEKELNKVMKLLKPGVAVWVYYPKGTSKVQTDLTRDKGWDKLLAHKDKLAWLNLISFNETWSVFGFRHKTETDKKKDEKPKPAREIFKWINPATKEVRLPDDLAAALKKNKKLNDYFHSLSFSHKKEYVEWVVEAKKEETRQRRIEGTLERLAKGWKNPANN